MRSIFACVHLCLQVPLQLGATLASCLQHVTDVSGKISLEDCVESDGRRLVCCQGVAQNYQASAAPTNFAPHVDAVSLLLESPLNIQRLIVQFRQSQNLGSKPVKRNSDLQKNIKLAQHTSLLQGGAARALSCGVYCSDFCSVTLGPVWRSCLLRSL